MKNWAVCGDKSGFYWSAYGKITDENSETIFIFNETSGEIETWDKKNSKIVRFDNRADAKGLYKEEYQHK